MARGVTIDNLPIDASVYWAIAQNSHHSQEVREAALFLSSTQIVVSEPVYDHLTLLFGQHEKARTWALFESPDIPFFRAHGLFGHSIIEGIDPTSLSEICHACIESLYENQKPTCPISCEKVLALFETLEQLNELLTTMRAKILQHRKS